jgi:hypothetical protein
MTTTVDLRPTTSTQAPTTTRDRRPVRTHLFASVLCALFGFAPLGVAAVVHAGNVRTRLALGDLQGARAESRTAARLCWASVLVTLGFLLVVAIGAGTAPDVP